MKHGITLKVRSNLAVRLRPEDEQFVNSVQFLILQEKTILIIRTSISHLTHECFVRSNKIRLGCVFSAYDQLNIAIYRGYIRLFFHTFCFQGLPGIKLLMRQLKDLLQKKR